MSRTDLLARVAAVERQAEFFASRVDKLSQAVELAAGLSVSSPVTPVPESDCLLRQDPWPEISSAPQSDQTHRPSPNAPEGGIPGPQAKPRSVPPVPPEPNSQTGPAPSQAAPSQAAPEATQCPLHYGTALIWTGRFLEAEKFFEQRIRNPSTHAKFPYPWAAAQPHPRDKLLHSDTAAMRFWMCGAIADAKLALDRYSEACEHAEVCCKLAQDAIQAVGITDDAKAVARFDYEDCRAVLATSVFFKAAFQIYTGAAVRGIVTLKKGWTLFADDQTAMDPSPTLVRRTSRKSGRNLDSNVEGPSENEQLVTGQLAAREPVGLNVAWNFGRGVYLLFMSMAPAKMIKVLEIVGFSADRRLGAELLTLSLRNVIDHGTTLADVPLAAAHCAHALAWDLVEFSNFNFSEGELPTDQRLQLGQKVVDRFATAYEHSPIFDWLGAVVKRRMGQFVPSLDLLKDITRDFVDRAGSTELPARVFTEAAFVSCLAEDHESVARFGNLVFNAREGGSSFPIFPLTALGVSCALSGNMNDAHQFFTRADNLTSHRPLGDIEDTLHSKSKAFRCRRFGIVVYGEFLICTFAQEDMEPSHVRSVLERLEPVLKELDRICSITPLQSLSSGTNGTSSWLSGVTALSRGSRRNSSQERSPHEELAAALYISGSLQSVVGNLSAAISDLNSSLSQAGGEPWICPFGHYQLARIRWSQGEREKAVEHLRLCKLAGNNFDGARTLKSRVKRLEIAMVAGERI